MEFLQHVIVMLVTLGVLIAFHEYGHFWVARRCGVKVLRYSIGFGPVLFRRTDKLGTEYAISALPLGGYVKMLDEREGEVSEAEREQAFNNKSVQKRIAIVSAGPIANFVLAIAVYWLVFLQGTTGLVPQIFSVKPDSPAAIAGLTTEMKIVAVDDEPVVVVRDAVLAFTQRIGETGVIRVSAQLPGSDIVSSHALPIERWLSDETEQVDILSSLGIGFYQPQVDAVVGEVVADSAAEKAGLISGDKIVSADGIAITDWMGWVDYVQARPEQSIALLIERDGRPLQKNITPARVMRDGQEVGQVGIRVEFPAVPAELLVKKHYSVFGAIIPALENTWNMSIFSLNSLKKMLFGELSYKQLSGPISIAKVATESAYSGIYSYLSLLALLSVSLAVLNLLPIPVLDGGHILFYLIEWVRGAPLSEKVQGLAYQLGMLVVLSVMVLAVVNDLGRL